MIMKTAPKSYLGSIHVLVPVIALSYVALVFAPSSWDRTLLRGLCSASLLGASSFSLLPLVLEYLVEITYPFPPEIGSTLCWTGGQLFGAVFIILHSALKADAAATPPSNMQSALIFSAVIAVAATPVSLSLSHCLFPSYCQCPQQVSSVVGSDAFYVMCSCTNSNVTSTTDSLTITIHSRFSQADCRRDSTVLTYSFP